MRFKFLKIYLRHYEFIIMITTFLEHPLVVQTTHQVHDCFGHFLFTILTPIHRSIRNIIVSSLGLRSLVECSKFYLDNMFSICEVRLNSFAVNHKICCCLLHVVSVYH